MFVTKSHTYLQKPAAFITTRHERDKQNKFLDKLNVLREYFSWHCLLHLSTICCTASGTNVILLLNDNLIRASKLLLSNLVLLELISFLKTLFQQLSLT